MKKIYLDYASTTLPILKSYMRCWPFFSEAFGNPSSVHSFGREAKTVIEDARAAIAQSLGVKPRDIVFTGGWHREQ